MSSPAIYGGSRTKILTSKGLLLKDGTPIDYNGQKNYITKGTFAINATTGWNLKRTTLSNLIPNQVAASWTTPSVLSVTATSTGALTQAGFSLSLSASGVTTAGDMLVSDSYTIDIEDQAKTLAFKFSYKAYTNPSNLNFSGTSSNTFHVYIYDDANSAWIQPTGCYSTIQSSGVGIATGTFQTPANMTSFRIAIVSCNASLNTTASGAFTMYFDNFSVGPQSTNMGVPITDLTAVSGYTLSSSTGSITNYILTTREARRGDKLYVEFEIAFTGTSSAFSEIFLNLRPGLSIDSSKIGTGGQIACEGIIRPLDAGVAGYGPGLFVVSSTTQVRMFQNSGGAFSNTSPFTFGNGDYLSGYFEVPISGWSSNTVMSSDSNLTTISARAYLAADQTGVSTYTTGAKVLFDTASTTLSRDKIGMFDTTNKRFNILVSGTYVISSMVTIASTNVLNNGYYLRLVKNGVAILRGDDQTPAANTRFTLNFNDIIDLIAGDYLEIEIVGQGDNTVNKLVIAGGQAISNFKITRIQGPQSIAASETVALAAEANNTNSPLTLSTSLQTIPFSNKVFDTHSAYSAAGVYTVPVSGTYLVTGRAWFIVTSGTATIGEEYLRLVIATSTRSVIQVAMATTTTAYSQQLNIQGTFKLLAGQTIRLQAIVASGINSILSQYSDSNGITITRVGN